MKLNAIFTTQKCKFKYTIYIARTKYTKKKNNFYIMNYLRNNFKQKL